MTRLCLKDACFKEKDINDNGYGGGVIPIAFDVDDNVYFLLGRERYANQWKGSCRWSGFEGSRKEHETLLSATIREFKEESLNTIINEDDILKVIDNKWYWTRIVMNVRTPNKPNKYHTTYFVRIDLDSNIPNYFNNVRSHIEYVEKLNQEWRHTKPKYFMEYYVGPIEEIDASVQVQIYKKSDNICTTINLYNKDAQYMWNWKLLRDKIDRAIQRDHECLRVLRDDIWNCVQDISIRKDYMEKDCIKWWSVKDLQKVMDNKGQLGTDRFRPFFLPVLQAILDEIIFHPPNSAKIPIIKKCTSAYKKIHADKEDNNETESDNC